MGRDVRVTTESGDRVRFDQLFSAHYEAVSRYCHRRLPPSDANDATAEVFVVTWKKINTVPDGEGALLWLYGVARNEVRRARRSNRRLGALRDKLTGQGAPPEPGPDSVVVRNEQHEHLLAALCQLRRSDQELLRLRAYEHLTMSEIAAVLGCSVSAAKKRSSRAMKRLRRAADATRSTNPTLSSRAIQERGNG